MYYWQSHKAANFARDWQMEDGADKQDISGAVWRDYF